MLRLGVTFPQTEIGGDPLVVRDFAQAVEGMGYAFLLSYDHVLGADPNRPGGWSGVYNYRDAFHEPFVLYGYLAGLTRRIQLVTGILILPQRQTALVAKQAAQVDVLSGGRLRLGVGIGWNAVEYDALGMNFHNRGRRVEEQVALLRELWTHEVVTFKGRWHRVDQAGLNPMPIQRPIPIWMGGYVEPVLRRIARMADGWIIFRRPEASREQIERLRALTREAGRPAESVGVMGGLSVRQGTPDDWMKTLTAWEEAGAIEVTVNTMGAGFQSPSDHLKALERVKGILGGHTP